MGQFSAGASRRIVRGGQIGRPQVPSYRPHAPPPPVPPVPPGVPPAKPAPQLGVPRPTVKVVHGKPITVWPWPSLAKLLAGKYSSPAAKRLPSVSLAGFTWQVIGMPQHQPSAQQFQSAEPWGAWLIRMICQGYGVIVADLDSGAPGASDAIGILLTKSATVGSGATSIHHDVGCIWEPIGGWQP